MRFLPFITILLFYIPLLSEASIPPTGSSEEWIQEIRQVENGLRHKLDKLRIKTFSKMPLNEKKELEASIDHIQKKLSKLKTKITFRSDEVFKNQSSDQWKNVVQQARALQRWNEDAVVDLRNSLKNTTQIPKK